MRPNDYTHSTHYCGNLCTGLLCPNNKTAAAGALPTGSAARKNVPIARGVLDYFPAAIAAVAELSQKGNDKHNPGEDLHHARGKSTDHADCILRHLIDRGTVDPEDGILHDVKVAWRALALLQEELEKRGAPFPRGARPAPETATLFEITPKRWAYDFLNIPCGEDMSRHTGEPCWSHSTPPGFGEAP